MSAETYITGKPCKRGHYAPRYLRSKTCIVCKAAHRIAWRTAHPERTREYDAVYYRKNPGKVRAKNAAYYNSNINRMRGRVALWKRENVDKVNARNGMDRARRNGAGGRGVTAPQRRQILANSVGICAYCNERRPLSLEHIEPLATGGTHDN